VELRHAPRDARRPRYVADRWTSTKRETELRRMRKGKREARCVAVHLPVSVDPRCSKAPNMLRSELFREGYALPVRSRGWQRALVKSGW
jgi:hypothetical protein